MRKFVLAAILMATALATTHAQTRGYKGMVNGGWIFLSEKTSFEVLTIHGYQFNPHLFVGGGAGINFYSQNRDKLIPHPDEGAYIPLFADIRGYLLKGKISPYAEAKIGGLLPVTDGGTSIYFAPEIGCKFGFSSRFAINIAAEYILQQDKTDNNNSIYDSFYIGAGGLCLKVGVEF